MNAKTEAALVSLRVRVPQVLADRIKRIAKAHDRTPDQEILRVLRIVFSAPPLGSDSVRGE